MKSSLADFLDTATLLTEAGHDAFARGSSAMKGHRVRCLRASNDTIHATVDDGEYRRVCVWIEDGDLRHSCSCADGGAVAMCAHVVAAALAWRQSQTAGTTEPSSSTERSAWASMRAQIEHLDKRDITELLSAYAQADERLVRHDAALSARNLPNGPSFARLHRMIDDAARPRALSSDQSAFEYARGLDEAVRVVQEILDERQPSAALELAEYAIDRIARACSQVRDDDGFVVEVLERIEELHLAACREARPEPRALARWLFAQQMRMDADVFEDAALRYRDILGRDGLDEYRKLARPLWEALRKLKPSELEGHAGQRTHLQGIMESLADAARSLDAWIEVQSWDLSSPGGFVAIAERCMRAGQQDRAVEWVRRGLNSFPGRPDVRLRQLQAELHHGEGRHSAATEVLWSCFVDDPDQGSYEKLLQSAATHGGVAKWRERAHAHIRSVLDVSIEKRQIGGSARWDRSLNNEWVRILVAERDFESAWREGCARDCAIGLLIDLAEQREKKHPEDVVPVYRRYVRELIDQREKHSYAAAVNAILHLRDLARRTRTEEEFAGYLLGLKQEHRAKINLMKSLKAARLIVEEDQRAGRA
jgi:uncharacterized Zn finger protein